MTIAATDESADHPADDPEADLLEQERRGAATLRDLGLDVGHRDRREQQRHADPVVEPALDVQPLADPRRDARLGDDRLPERGVGRREHHRQDHRLLDGQRAEDRRRREGAERDRQRQPDAEQAQRQPDLAAELPEIDARGVAEQHQRERRLRQRSHGRARALEVDPVEHLGPDQHADGDEHHRRRDRRAQQPPRDRRDAEQRERHDGERPLHSAPPVTGSGHGHRPFRR